MILLVLELIVSICIVVLCCKRIDKLINDDDATFGKILFYVFGLVIGIICSGMCIFGAIAFEENNKYPASKYRIETEITTRGEQSDTTYVIVKK